MGRHDCLDGAAACRSIHAEQLDRTGGRPPTQCLRKSDTRPRRHRRGSMVVQRRASDAASSHSCNRCVTPPGRRVRSDDRDRRGVPCRLMVHGDRMHALIPTVRRLIARCRRKRRPDRSERAATRTCRMQACRNARILARSRAGSSVETGMIVDRTLAGGSVSGLALACRRAIRSYAGVLGRH